jgi:hypothetical protein
MAYRSAGASPEGSKIVVACRVTHDPENTTYQEYEIPTAVRCGEDGKSDKAPTLCEFKGRLYVFWKTKTTGRDPGGIVYTSTEDGQNWQRPLQRTSFETRFPPAVGLYGGRLYLAYISASSEITISSTADVLKWSKPSFQQVGGPTGPIAKASYPPCFSASLVNGLTMFWGTEHDEDRVFYCPLNTTGIDAASGDSPLINVTTASPNKVAAGAWQTQVGNMVVYRPQNQWIITTTRNGEISIASGADFQNQYNLTELAGVESGKRCGVCLIPGYFSRKFGKKWQIALVFRGYNNDPNLYEMFIDFDV